MSSFRGVSTFKKAVMNLLVKMATEEEMEPLRAQFQIIDKDGTGLIEASELKEIIKKKRRNMKVSEEEIQGIIAQMDYHDNQMINYSEFLAATVDTQIFITEPRLKVAFNQFDTD